MNWKTSDWVLVIAVAAVLSFCWGAVFGSTRARANLERKSLVSSRQAILCPRCGYLWSVAESLTQ